MTSSSAVRTSLIGTVRATVQSLWQEVAKFGLVGLFTLVVDVGLFNLLRYGGAGGEGLLFDKPLTAKVISTVVAITISYFANRHWTFANRARTGFAREYVLFFAISGAAMLISLATLWTSHYALGLANPVADNISANVVGLALGTIFRFWAYRRFVFPAPADPLLELPAPVSESASA
jgi:putative flippase GtrA